MTVLGVTTSLGSFPGPESEQYAMLRLANQLVGMGAALLMCTASHAHALNINQDPKPNDYYFGRAIAYPVQHREKVFRPDRNKANFTVFHGVENVTVADGRLAFTLKEKQTTLGWGNYMGGQPAARRRLGQTGLRRFVLASHQSRQRAVA